MLKLDELTKWHKRNLQWILQEVSVINFLQNMLSTCFIGAFALCVYYGYSPPKNTPTQFFPLFLGIISAKLMLSYIKRSASMYGLSHLSAAFALALIPWILYWIIAITLLVVFNISNSPEILGVIFSMLNNIILLIIVFPVVIEVFEIPKRDIVRFITSKYYYTSAYLLCLLSIVWNLVIHNSKFNTANFNWGFVYEVCTSLIVGAITFSLFYKIIRSKKQHSFLTLLIVTSAVMVLITQPHYLFPSLRNNTSAFADWHNLFIVTTIFSYWAIINLYRTEMLEEKISALDCSTNGISVHNYDGTILWSNAVSEAYNNEGKSLQDISSISSEELNSQLSKCIETGRAEYLSSNETTGKKYKTTLSKIELQRRIVAVDTDVTGFLNRIQWFAHDIKNPFIWIRDFAELLIEEEDIKNNLTGLEIIQRMHFVAVTAHENVLKYQNYYSRDEDTEKSWFSLYKIFNSIRKSTGPICAFRKIQFTVTDNVAALPDLYASSMTTEIGMYNLVFNSINALLRKEATQEEESITIDAYSIKDKVIISICDTGDGMEREKLNEINTFFTEPEADIKRMGFGFAIVRNFADLMKANVRLNLNDRGGVCVNISIPKNKFKI